MTDPTPPTSRDETLRAAVHAWNEVHRDGGCVHFDKGFGPYAACEDPDNEVPIRALPDLLAASVPPRPDDALREAAQAVVDAYTDREGGVIAGTNSGAPARYDAMTALRAALATPAAAVREAGVDGDTLEYDDEHRWLIVTERIEYDDEHRWFIVTERIGPDEWGASAIVAKDVSPSFAARILARLAEQPDQSGLTPTSRVPHHRYPW